MGRKKADFPWNVLWQVLEERESFQLGPYSAYFLLIKQHLEELCGVLWCPRFGPVLTVLPQCDPSLLDRTHGTGTYDRTCQVEALKSLGGRKAQTRADKPGPQVLPCCGFRPPWWGMAREVPSQRLSLQARRYLFMWLKMLPNQHQMDQSIQRSVLEASGCLMQCSCTAMFPTASGSL